MNDDQIRSAFHRLDRDVRGAIRPTDNLARVRRRRWGRLVLVPVGAAALVAAAVIGVALFIGDPEPPPVATTMPTPTTVPNPTTVPTPTTVPPDDDGTTVTTMPTEAVEGGVTPTMLRGGEVLYASSEGVFVDGPAGLQPITSVPAVVALGDLRGGILYQSAAPPGESGHIWHLAAMDTRATLLVANAELHDSALVDGEPTVVYTQHVAVGEGSAAGRVYMGPVAGGRAPTLVFDGFEGEGAITRVSYGGGIFAITQAAEGLTWFDFVDVEGQPVDVVNPRPFDAGDDRYTDQGVLDADGTVLAFLQADGPVVAAGDPVEVVVRDLRDGTEYFRVSTASGDEQAAGASYWFVRADYDGQRMLIERIDDATRAPIGSAEVVLDERTVTAGAAAGAPAIVDFVAPLPPPEPVAGPVVPAGGFGRGVLVANWERVVWYPHPAGGTLEAPTLVWEFPQDRSVPGSQVVFGDGAGGVIFGGGSSPLRHLRPGADAAQADVVADPDDDFRAFGTAVIDGVPTLYGGLFDLEEPQLVTIAIPTGERTVVGTLPIGQGFVNDISFDGERFWVATLVEDGTGFCTETITFDLQGVVGEPSGVPATCTADTQYGQARVSPDGSLVAYIEAAYSLDGSVFGGPGTVPPIDVVVAATGDGQEIARIPVGTEAQGAVLIHAFDGERVVFSRQGEEPALAEQAMFVVDLACGPCVDRIDSVAAEAALTGTPTPAAEPVTSEPLPGCSTDGRGVLILAQEGLPSEVAKLRADILDAADRCDFIALEDLAYPGDFSYDFQPGETVRFREADDASGDVLLIAGVLAMPYGTVEAGGETIYVWPEVATYESWDQVTTDDQNRLSFVYDFPEQRRFAEAGAYLGLRVGITESGDWVFVATGD